jgi:hypothetical protein
MTWALPLHGSLLALSIIFNGEGGQGLGADISILVGLLEQVFQFVPLGVPVHIVEVRPCQMHPSDGTPSIDARVPKARRANIVVDGIGLKGAICPVRCVIAAPVPHQESARRHGDLR